MFRLSINYKGLINRNKQTNQSNELFLLPQIVSPITTIFSSLGKSRSDIEISKELYQVKRICDLQIIWKSYLTCL